MSTPLQALADPLWTVYTALSTNEVVPEAATAVMQQTTEQNEVARIGKELEGYQQQLFIAEEARTAASATLGKITADTQTGIMSQDDADSYAAAKLHLQIVSEFCSMAELACRDATLELNAARHGLKAQA